VKGIVEEWDGNKTTRRVVENTEIQDVNEFLMWLHEAHPNATLIDFADNMTDQDIRRRILHCQ